MFFLPKCSFCLSVFSVTKSFQHYIYCPSSAKPGHKKIIQTLMKESSVKWDSSRKVLGNAKLFSFIAYCFWCRLETTTYKTPNNGNLSECCDLISRSHRFRIWFPKGVQVRFLSPPLYTQAAVANCCESSFFCAQRHEVRFPTESDKFFHYPVIQINRLFHATIVSTFGSHFQNWSANSTPKKRTKKERAKKLKKICLV